MIVGEKTIISSIKQETETYDVIQRVTDKKVLQQLKFYSQVDTFELTSKPTKKVNQIL